MHRPGGRHVVPANGQQEDTEGHQEQERANEVHHIPVTIGAYAVENVNAHVIVGLESPGRGHHENQRVQIGYAFLQPDPAEIESITQHHDAKRQ